MTTTWGLARAGAVAHRSSLAGTGLVLAAAGCVVSVTGVLMESGLRAAVAGDPAGGALSALASSFAGTALVVVLLVVTSTVGLVVRARSRELALLRTVGATTRQVRQLVSRETLLVALASVPLGALPGLWLAHLLGPLLRSARILDAGDVVAVSPLPVVAATLLLAPTAVLAGRLACRGSTGTPVGRAVGRSAVESHQIGTVRRVTALVLAVCGLGAAATPLFVPGTIGAASGATSAFLLLGAAACAGPVLVHGAFAHAARLTGPGRRPVVRLALSNVHGFSRRLTTVVVPLALVVATGTIQTTVDRSISLAAHEQLADALGGDLVVTGAHAETLDDLTGADGVRGVAELGSTEARVRVDADLPGALGWESVALRVVPPDVPASLLDPDVSAGSLGDLAEPDTVAVSSDVAFELGTDVGGTVPVRFGDSRAPVVETRVVAVYDRGLGLGGYLVGPATPSAHGIDTSPDTALVATSLGRDDVASLLGDIGRVATTAAYVDEAGSPEAAAQRLSTVLLLALLLFVVLGAATTVALSTASRRTELGLLRRTGATRRQLLRMIATESLLTGGLACLVGTVVVVPAVLAVTVGFLGPSVPAVDLATYAALTVTALVVSLGVALVTAVRVTRTR